MNQITPDRRNRQRMSVSGKVILIAGDTHVPAQIEDISFAGLRCRAAPPGALDALDQPIEGGVKIEDMPALRVSAKRIDGDVFAATYVNRDLAGRIIAGGFIELFTKTKG